MSRLPEHLKLAPSPYRLIGAFVAFGGASLALLGQVGTRFVRRRWDFGGLADLQEFHGDRPWSLWQWLEVAEAFHFWELAGEIRALGNGIIGFSCFVGLIVPTILFRRKVEISDFHGSARLATRAEMKEAALLSDQGVCLGRERSSSLFRGRVVRCGDPYPVAMFGTVGAGKTQTAACTVLEWGDDPDGGAIVVLDPKLENFKVMGGGLERKGYRVFQVSPTSTHPLALRWNPMEEIPVGEHDVGRLQQVAEELFAPSDAKGGDNAEHFAVRSSQLFLCLALHSIYREGGRGSFGEILDFVSAGADDDPLADLEEETPEVDVDGFKLLLEEIAVADHDPDWQFKWFDREGRETETHPVARALAQGFINTPTRELGSIVSSVLKTLNSWIDPRIQAATEVSDFSFAEFARAAAKGEKVAVFLTMSSEDVARLKGYLRVFLMCFWWFFGPQEGQGDISISGRKRALLLIDETAQLGMSPTLPRIASMGRSAGVVLVMIWQQLSQIKKVWGQDEEISGGCPIWWYAANPDSVLHQKLRELIGPVTLLVRGTSYSYGQGRSKSISTEKIQRPFFTDGELATLPRSLALVMKSGCHPVLVKRRMAWKEPRLLILLNRKMKGSGKLLDSKGRWGGRSWDRSMQSRKQAA